MTGFAHRDRKRISDEAEVIIRLKKAREVDIRRQLAKYQAAGFDISGKPQRSITNGGALLRRKRAQVEEFERLWWQEISTESLRDQMSIDYAAWRAGLQIGRFPGNPSRNPYMQFRYFNRPTNDF